MFHKPVNNLINDEKNLPSPLVRNGFIFITSIILFVAAIYYGIINP